MPSPFPGMDPFLEDPVGWPDVHHELLSSLRSVLRAVIAPQFQVRIEERVYVTDPDDDPGYPYLVPDLIITRGHGERPQPASRSAIATPVRIETLLDPEIHDRYLEVREGRSGRIVAAIELLSPTNKAAGSRGRETMSAKRRQLHQAGAHWLEIDLLRAGDRGGRRSDYRVLLQRVGDDGAFAWFIDLRDTLPVVGVPLVAGMADAPLDLQAALDDAYDRAGYDDLVDYARPVPPPPLRPADSAWVQARLAAAGATRT